MANEIYARGAVHIQSFEAAVRDGIAWAEARDDKRLVGQLRGVLAETQALHKRVDKIAEPYVSPEIRPLIGGGK